MRSLIEMTTTLLGQSIINGDFRRMLEKIQLVVMHEIVGTVDRGQGRIDSRCLASPERAMISQYRARELLNLARLHLKN